MKKTKKQKTLVLTTETIKQLQADQLGAAAGGRCQDSSILTGPSNQCSHIGC